MTKTNPYIHINKNIEKLLETYNKHGSLVIGVDFDNTLYNVKENTAYADIVELVKQAKAENFVICIWTANADETLVKNFCKEYGINYDYYNESPLCENTSRKAHFNLLLDDTAGLGYSVIILETILWLLRDN